MSHFTVLVIGKNYEEQLAPYDEQLETPEYLKGEVSKEDINDFVVYYTKSNPENIDLSVEELYQKFGKDWNDGAWRFENGKINEYSDYNPNSKWDWYKEGGRWDGYLELIDGASANCATMGEVKKPIKPTFAVVKNGEWYEKGDMGWWGIVKDEKEQGDWNKEFEKLLEDVSDDTELTIVDCHI